MSDQLGLRDIVDHVACFLSDKSPLACVASFARCSCHFRSYLISNEQRIHYWCHMCGDEFSFDVESHRHLGGEGILFFGQKELYVWKPDVNQLFCMPCFARYRRKFITKDDPSEDL